MNTTEQNNRVIHTTLNEIRKYNPCSDSWGILLQKLGKTGADDEPLAFTTVLEALNIQDAVWCLRVLDYKDRCLFQADVAESVVSIYENKYPADSRVRDCINGIRNFSVGKINRAELKVLQDAAYVAAYVAASVAAYVAYAAADAADAATTAYVTAYVTAYAAASVAASYDAAAYNAAASSRDRKWKEIEQLFIKHFGE